MENTKTLKRQAGLSLTELLVASILIGIVMLGIVSFSFSIKQFQKTTDKSTILAMKAATAMSFIRKDIEQAIGDGSHYGSGDFGSENLNINAGGGIRKWTAGTDMRSICFRHDINSTPSNYSDDSWACYCKNFIAPQVLTRCDTALPSEVPTQWIGNGCVCKDAGHCDFFNDLLTFTKGASNFFEITTIDGQANSPIKYITITLDTSWDGTINPEPLNNPQYILQSTIYPSAHSQ